jgi:hypothetical protein
LTCAALIPFRIRIGVTGHRTFPDPSSVENLARAAIGTLIETLYPPEARIPITYSVVTALAEGADRIVARAVLGYEGARLDVVLPMRIEDYLEDFKTPQSQQEFASLLALCRHPVMLRRTRIDAEARTPEEAQKLRRAAYESAGRWVVSHCDVLIAVWDGEAAHGRGGTADIVEYAKSQRCPVIRIWNGEATIYEKATPVRALRTLLRNRRLLRTEATARINRAQQTAAERDLAEDHRFDKSKR